MRVRIPPAHVFNFPDDADMRISHDAIHQAL
jgi:hypothetical protein